MLGTANIFKIHSHAKPFRRVFICYLVLVESTEAKGIALKQKCSKTTEVVNALGRKGKQACHSQEHNEYTVAILVNRALCRSPAL